jgi:glycosyltransferase involved in cell wall biosynthesis
VTPDSRRPSRQRVPAHRVTVIGHASGTREQANGQIIRTRLTIDEISAALGTRVHVVDTGAAVPDRPRALAELTRALVTSAHILHMPGARGLAQLTPILAMARRVRPMSLHLCAIGGWLPGFLSSRPSILAHLSTYATVFVQTRRMVAELGSQGLHNVVHLPNFRRFHQERPPRSIERGALRLVFMSRIVPDKGVATAIDAMRSLAPTSPRGTAVSLDIWGPVDPGHVAWFDAAMREAPSSVVYRGVAPADRVHAILREYDAMVFPTQYRGEGFPGAILDAMIAGIPVIASRWLDMEEWVEDGVSGFLLPPGDVPALSRRLAWCASHPHDMDRLAAASWQRAERFHADRVVPIMLGALGIEPLGPDARASEGWS